MDSHTEGEPTRVVVAGGPDLGGMDMAARRDALREKHDWVRRRVVLEPRGAEIQGGALLTEPVEPGSAAGVVFFNNTGYLGMCGHGLIGVVETMAWMGKLPGDACRIDTPVGTVVARRGGDGAVTVENVRSYREAGGVEVMLDDGVVVRGDVAWGGNWFFLTSAAGIPVRLGEVGQLSAMAARVRRAVNAGGWPEVDHVELLGTGPGGVARAFVWCPGGVYDRSPCGTGVSAKMACLAADGLLDEGADWVQESVLGTRFRGRYRWAERPDGGGAHDRRDILPEITGRAWITATGRVVAQPDDPFRDGIPSGGIDPVESVDGSPNVLD